MRRYYLASPDAKQNVDLRDFEDVIVAAVMEVMKGVEGVSVVVCEQYYEVSPSPKRNHAVAIGRKICKSGLSQHCVQIPKLFLSREESSKEEKKNEEEGVKVLKRPLQDGKYEWLFSSETCGYLHGCGVWKDDAETNRRTLLMAQNNTAPDMLVSKGYLLINDILINIFGADGTSYGATHGWIIDPKTGEIPTISFGLNDIAENPDLLRFLNGAEPNAWLRFNCDPEPIADKIDALQAKRYYKRRIGDRTQRYAPV